MKDSAPPWRVFRLLLLSSVVALAGPVRGELPSFSGGAPLSQTPSSDPLIETVPAMAPPPHWDRFLIMIWQHGTQAQRDLSLYRQAGFGGFHIDRGAGQSAVVNFAREQGLPYYVDHAADKGLLHLTDRTGVDTVLRQKNLVVRPHSLADQETLETLKSHLDRNIEETRKGPVVAYSFDDEISLGSFNSPAEVDASPASVAGFRRWLKASYASIEALNQCWGSKYRAFEEAEPVSFEAIRGIHRKGPFRDWRLAQWMDWRAYMDSQFASVLGELTRHANQLDPGTPAGFVGGQQPSAYGGFDYAKLCRSVQFMEAYDIGATNEILRSFWGEGERRPFVQTWFSTGSARWDSWFLWYYLVHGNRGVIAWPDSGGGAWFQEGKGLLPHIAALAGTSREVQGSVSEAFLSKDSRFDPDPIAVYHSMPSIRASWVTDVIPHGGTWPNRSSSLDNRCQSAGKNREAWFKLLEDGGFQYQVVDASQLASDHLIAHGYRVLILNRAMCLSDREIEALERFVAAGGCVIADHWSGVLDERGNGRELPNRVDRLFRLDRSAVTGYFGGDGVCELNGEKYQQPYLDRLEYSQADRSSGIVLVGESGGTPSPVITRHAGGGTTIFLDRSPLEYWDNAWRMGAGGESWRELLGGIFSEIGMTARASVVDAIGEPVPLAELLYWKSGTKRVTAVVMNPTRQGTISGLGKIDGVPREAMEITIRFREPRRELKDVRTGEAFPDGDQVTVDWRPWEALVVESR